MALINCPECGKAFSDKAATCPNCAYPLTETDRIKLGVADSHIAIEKANKYYDEDKLKPALEIYLALSEEGNREACYKAGYMLCNGYGTQADVQKGVKLLKKSAENNYPKALFSLACYYDTAKDSENALRYFKQAEEFIESFNGDEQAHIKFKIGQLISEELNFDEKLKYLESAVSLGADYANKYLAQLYHTKGENLFNDGNYRDAADNFMYAINYGSEISNESFGKCYCQLAELEDDPESKLLILIKASKLGSQTARDALSQYYLENSTDNIANLEKSAYYGNEKARTKLGIYYNEKGVECYNNGDLTKAENYFERAAEFDNDEAKANLAIIYNRIGVQYYNGDNVETDYKKSEELFLKAKKLGSDDAVQNLGTLYNQYGLIYQHGNNVKRNFDTAEDYFIKANDCNNEPSRKNLIMLYVTGYFNQKHGINGFHKDEIKAMAYLSKAKKFDPELVSQIGNEYYDKAMKLIARGIDKENYKKINSYLKRASRLGDGDVSSDLIDFYKTVSSLYKHGKKGFDKSKSRANHYMRKAAELGDREAIKKYKPNKSKGSNLFSSAFESLTGTSLDTISKSRNKNNYNYYDGNHYYKK